MIQIVYTSIATQPFNAADLRRLLTASRLRNQAADLTGVLMYRDGTFVQLLEGPADRLDATLARIRKDPRHSNVRVLSEDMAQTRLFPEWRMRFSDGSSETQMRKGFDTLAGGASFGSMSDEDLVRFIRDAASQANAALGRVA